MNVNFTLDNIREVAKAVIAFSTKHKVIAFHGGMGAGKTTFIQHFTKRMDKSCFTGPHPAMKGYHFMLG